jgi:small subunit ribosomal protein S21
VPKEAFGASQRIYWLDLNQVHMISVPWRVVAEINLGGLARRRICDRLGGVRHLAEVRLQDGETLENALRRFKRKVQQEDIIKEVKRHSFYLKPGEKLRVKQALARKRNRKKSRREIE